MAKITVIGGDERLRILVKKLMEEGYEVDTLGLYDSDAADFQTSTAIVLPVPTTKDKKTVFTPLTGRKILLSDIADIVNDNQLILCCNWGFEGKKCIDYNKLDSYALLNAVPTAEGAIKIAIENTPFTLWKSKVLVIGNGRVGKILSHRLKGMGCDVTVSARKTTDEAFIKALGFRYINTGTLNQTDLPYDIIFNTVDFKVLEDSVFKKSRCALAVDLSSAGGFSISAAQSADVKAIMAPGLPGKIAPLTAGEILYETISEILKTN
ncbi:MAG: hypothetical protein II234_03880 [Clostridia bacterium]|nr:hypothetical protein [Clostridia bacterium]